MGVWKRLAKVYGVVFAVAGVLYVSKSLGRKLMSPQKKSDCAAILIASSCATSWDDVVARKGADKASPQGNLRGSKMDVAQMYKVCVKSRGIQVIKTFDNIDIDPRNATTKSDILQSLKQMFQDTGRKSFILYYSGHGLKPTGDWCFEETNNFGKSSLKLISFKNILDLWNNRKKPLKNSQKLIIIADCCFSGVWVSLLKKLKPLDIIMQAACGVNEQSQDCENGGVFTVEYTKTCFKQSWSIEPYFYTFYIIPIAIKLIAGAATAIYLGGPFIIGSAIISTLYNKVAADFTPVYYKPEQESQLTTFSNLTDAGKCKYSLSMQLTDDWTRMNRSATTQMMEKLGCTGNIWTV